MPVDPGWAEWLIEGLLPDEFVDPLSDCVPIDPLLAD